MWSLDNYGLLISIIWNIFYSVELDILQMRIILRYHQIWLMLATIWNARQKGRRADRPLLPSIVHGRLSVMLSGTGWLSCTRSVFQPLSYDHLSRFTQTLTWINKAGWLRAGGIKCECNRCPKFLVYYWNVLIFLIWKKIFFAWKSCVILPLLLNLNVIKHPISLGFQPRM